MIFSFSYIIVNSIPLFVFPINGLINNENNRWLQVYMVYIITITFYHPSNVSFVVYV